MIWSLIRGDSGFYLQFIAWQSSRLAWSSWFSIRPFLLFVGKNLRNQRLWCWKSSRWTNFPNQQKDNISFSLSLTQPISLVLPHRTSIRSVSQSETWNQLDDKRSLDIIKILLGCSHCTMHTHVLASNWLTEWFTPIAFQSIQWRSTNFYEGLYDDLQRI
jgi:hypothetical protein